MNPTQFYKAHPKDHVKAVAEAAGTTLGNFQQIAIANGSVSARLARELEHASGGVMTVLEILFPDEASGNAGATTCHPGPPPCDDERVAAA